jgi:two-component system, chemotaxis family, protein-glutamate methylesterase/glutaminase
MPKIDGITLIREVRSTIHPVPAILMITAIATTQAKEHALDSGADEFLTKPYIIDEVLASLENCLARQKQQEILVPDINSIVIEPVNQTKPPFVAVGITGNTGAPNALAKFFETFPQMGKSTLFAMFIVLPVPAWALEMFALRLQKQTRLKVMFAEDGLNITPGTVYIARKDRHLSIEPDTFRMKLLDFPPQNFCRPSADILFQGISQAFRDRGIAVAMTGIGKDGLLGATHIKENGGLVLAQDPATTDAPYLTQTLIDLGTAQQAIPLPILGKTVYEHIEKLYLDLVVYGNTS